MSHQSQEFSFHVALRAAVSALVIMFVLAAVAMPAQAQTFKVIHSFTGGGDGAGPFSNLVMDKAGNLYGTTSAGGAGFGTVFKMHYANSGWLLTPLYRFQGGTDGIGPLAGVVLGPDGSLYGTTGEGGNGACNGVGCGTVYQLRPSPTRPRTPLDPWKETVLYRFSGDADGARPESDLIFDQAGNLYGTTYLGGQFGMYCSTGCGVAFELVPSGGTWTESVIHAFLGYDQDGQFPTSGMTFDAAGNLYGTTFQGGTIGNGTVYELTPSGSGWTSTALHNFDPEQTYGIDPMGGVIFDSAGNLYAATSSGAGSADDALSVFQMTLSSGKWTLHPLYTMDRSSGGFYGPWGRLTMDAAGSLYGTTYAYGVYGLGSVFKLTYSNGSWIPTVLHDFTGGADGGSPQAGVTLDANGNIYGTAFRGGSGEGYGVVWEITP